MTGETFSNTIRFLYLHKDGQRIPLRRGDEPHGAAGVVFVDEDTVIFSHR